VVVCEILEVSSENYGSICYVGYDESAGPITTENFVDLILRMVGVLMAPAAALAFGALVYGGYTYIMSAGDEAKSTKAKRIILYAFLGLVTIGIAGIIVNVVLNLILI
jgi:hypothetical protein